MRIKKARTGTRLEKAHSNTRYALCGVATGGLLACVTLAPATWLAKGVERATQGYVRLVNPVGTVWNGSAALVLASGAGGSTALSLPSRMAWQIRPSWSGLQVALEAACCTPAPVRMHIAAQSLRIASANLHMPLALLQGLGTPWNTLELRGDVQLQWQPLTVSWSGPGTVLDGVLEVQARNVSSRLSTLPDVGSYQIRVQGGAQPSLDVRTLRGALTLQGQGRWEHSKFRFDGQAHAQPEQATELANLLTLLGSKRGNTTMIRWG